MIPDDATLAALPTRKHSAVLREMLPLVGARIADVGCGDGSLARFLTREGGRVTGIECNEASLDRARAAEPLGDEDFVMGWGEDLPFDDDTFDMVIYFNSLHHVAVDKMEEALAEAARVVKPGGLLYVQEPISAGPFHELVVPVDDETEVQAAAYRTLEAVVAGGAFERVDETIYWAPYRLADFAALKKLMLGVDPSRTARFEQVEEELRRRFEALGEQRDGGWWFPQPARATLLRRRSES